MKEMERRKGEGKGEKGVQNKQKRKKIMGREKEEDWRGRKWGPKRFGRRRKEDNPQREGKKVGKLE